MAPIIFRPALLGATADGFEQTPVGINAKILLAKLYDFVRLRTRDLSTKQSASPINPAIETVLQAVHAGLIILRRKAGEQRLDIIGLAVAVGIAQKRMSGAAQTKTPSRQTVTPVGKGIPSRKSFASS